MKSIRILTMIVTGLISVGWICNVIIMKIMATQKELTNSLSDLLLQILLGFLGLIPLIPGMIYQVTPLPKDFFHVLMIVIPGIAISWILLHFEPPESPEERMERIKRDKEFTIRIQKERENWKGNLEFFMENTNSPFTFWAYDDGKYGFCIGCSEEFDASNNGNNDFPSFVCKKCEEKYYNDLNFRVELSNKKYVCMKCEKKYKIHKISDKRNTRYCCAECMDYFRKIMSQNN